MEEETTCPSPQGWNKAEPFSQQQVFGSPSLIPFSTKASLQIGQGRGDSTGEMVVFRPCWAELFTGAQPFMFLGPTHCRLVWAWESAFLAGTPGDFDARAEPYDILVRSSGFVHLIILCQWVALNTDLES